MKHIAAAVLAVVGLSACSSSSPSGPESASDSANWPVQTTDPTSHPGFYDTEVIKIDDSGKPIVYWQHTSAGQYEQEVAAHMGIAPPPAPDATSNGDLGTSSSAVISQDDCSSTNSVWLYNYYSTSWNSITHRTTCNAPDGLSKLRICFDNSDPSIGDYHDLANDSFYLDDGKGGLWGPYSWAGNVYMVWPPGRAGGTENGSLDSMSWGNCNGFPCQIYAPTFSWSGTDINCEQVTNVSHSGQNYLYIK